MSADDAVTTSAIRRHEERLERDPASLAFAPLADLYRRVGRTREAIDLCRQGLARYPQYTTARLILARALVAEGELDQAQAELRTLLEANAQDVLSHRLAAEVERRQGRVDTAAEHLEAVVRLDPSDRESRALLTVLRTTPPPGPEPTGLGRVLADDTFVTSTFGAVCLDQGLAEEAGHIFTRILRKDPDNARARTGLEGALKARLRRKG
jgi:tetratricopeptide (TPR) repeat protein